jgi:hypothetical protein
VGVEVAVEVGVDVRVAVGVTVRVAVGVKVRVAVAVLVGVGVLVAPEPHGLTRVTSAQPDEKPTIVLLPLTVHDAGQLERESVDEISFCPS